MCTHMYTHVLVPPCIQQVCAGRGQLSVVSFLLSAERSGGDLIKVIRLGGRLLYLLGYLFPSFPPSKFKFIV